MFHVKQKWAHFKQETFVQLFHVKQVLCVSGQTKNDSRLPNLD
jgi:hypothetical protein